MGITSGELLEGITDFASLPWQWPARSGPSSDDCVVVAKIPGGVAIGDSKDLTQRPMVYTASEWRVFHQAALDGEYVTLI